MSNAAWLTLGSQQYGRTVFRTLQPLISSNLRLKDGDMVLLMPMRVRIWVATLGEGLSLSSKRQIRVKGRAAENLVWNDGTDTVEINISRTCSAFSCGFV